jgi:hypothetical protein
LRDGFRIGKHAIDPYRLGDVLQSLVAERMVAADQPVFYLLVNAPRDIDRVRLRN